MQEEMNNISTLFDKGALEEAREQCAALAAQHPTNDRVTYALGMICQKMGDVEGAVKAYTSTVENAPNHLLALVNLSSLLITLGKPEVTVELLEQAVNLDPNGFPARYNLARAFYELGEMERALEQALFARSLDDGVPQLHDLLEQIYLKKNDAPKAEASARRRDQLANASRNGAA